jgi:DNA ligase (NAD+)
MSKEDLEREIDVHDNLYWNMHEPVITDAEYDVLIEKLKAIDPQNERVKKINSPKIDSYKIKHLYPMLSQDKVYTEEDLISWCIKLSRTTQEYFEFSPKYDGCSAEFISGISLSTRGDGIHGDDITDKLKFIDMSRVKDSVYYRGEIIINDFNFDILNKYMVSKSLKPYKNQRNTVGGILSQLNLPDDFPVVMEFIPFDNMVVYYKMCDIDNELIQRYCEYVKTLTIPTDGFVIKILDLKYKEILGETSHHSKSEIAFKFKNPSKITRLVDVMWSCGKNRITPIGLIEPVEINGVTIRKVNLHNMRNIMDKNIQIGNQVLIERAGDVIPDIIEILPSNSDSLTKINIPICPACGSECVFNDPMIICLNENCSGRDEVKLLDSIVRIGLENIGKPTIKKIIELYNVKNLIDLVNLTKNDFLKLEGFAETSATNIYDEIQKLKNTPIQEWRVLASLNISGIGERMSKEILKSLYPIPLIRVVDEMLDDYESCSNRFINIPGIGYKRCIELFDGLNDNKEYLNQIFSQFSILLTSNVIEKNDLLKKTVCLTGSFFAPKSELKKMIEASGEFEVVGSVNKNLNILIVSDPSKNSSKQQLAEKLNIEIISLTDFENKYLPSGE